MKSDTKDFDVTMNVKIPASRIVNLFITACEGGSNYWCQELTPKGKGDAYFAMLEGFELIEGEERKKHKITPTMIKNAINVFPVSAPRHFADFMQENDDAETGDVFLQLCVFGEIIYG